MLRSFSPRDTFIVSGVVIIHLFAFLLFAPSPFDGEQSLSSESMAVRLVNPNTYRSSQQKETSVSKTTTITSTENIYPSPSEVSSVSGGEGGGGYSASLIPRQVLHQPKPIYPLLSRKLKEQGMVMIKLCANQGGFVDEASVSRSSGFQALD